MEGDLRQGKVQRGEGKRLRAQKPTHSKSNLGKFLKAPERGALLFSAHISPSHVFFCKSIPSPRAVVLHLQPGVINGRRHGGTDGGGANVTNDVECLTQGVVHTQHLVPVLRLLCRLLHQSVLVTARVQLGQKLCINKLLGLKVERWDFRKSQQLDLELLKYSNASSFIIHSHEKINKLLSGAFVTGESSLKLLKN